MGKWAKGLRELRAWAATPWSIQILIAVASEQTCTISGSAGRYLCNPTVHPRVTPPAGDAMGTYESLDTPTHAGGLASEDERSG